MKHGSVRRTIALPNSLIGSLYAPDGLSEAAIDALLAEAGVEVHEPPVGEPALVLSMRADGQRLTQTHPTGSEAA